MFLYFVPQCCHAITNEIQYTHRAAIISPAVCRAGQQHKKTMPVCVSVFVVVEESEFYGFFYIYPFIFMLFYKLPL